MFPEPLLATYTKVEWGDSPEPPAPPPLGAGEELDFWLLCSPVQPMKAIESTREENSSAGLDFIVPIRYSVRGEKAAFYQGKVMFG